MVFKRQFNITPAKDLPEAKSRPSISELIDDGFYRLGIQIAKHPWKIIFVSSVIVLLFSAGLMNARMERDPKQLWVSEETSFLRDVEWLKDTFVEGSRVQFALVSAPNVLAPAVLRKVLYITQSINDMSVVVQPEGRSLSYSDICFEVPLIGRFINGDGSNLLSAVPLDQLDDLICSFAQTIPRACLVSSILDLWHNDEDAIEKLSEDDILDALNSGPRPSVTGFEFNPDRQLGGIERDALGKVTKATSMLISWVIRLNYSDIDLQKNGNNGGTEDWITLETSHWENGFLDRMRELKLELGSDQFRLEYRAERSYGDIAIQTNLGGSNLAIIGTILMLVYMQLVLGKFSQIEMRFLLSVFGLLGIGMAMVISCGVYTASGLAFVTPHLSVPFVIMGLGIDDIFVMITSLRKIRSDHADAPLPEQIGLMLQHAGKAVTVTSLTDLVAFMVGLMSSFPGMRTYCLLSAISIFTTYLLVITYFVAVLTLDERRVLARRSGIIPCIVHSEKASKLCCNPRLMDRCMELLYSKCILTTAGKVIILGVTAAVTIWSAINFTKLRAVYDQYNYLSNENYLQDFRRELERAFPERGSEAFIFLGELDYSVDLENMVNLTEQLNNRSDIIQYPKSWSSDFSQYLLEMYDRDIRETPLTEDDFSMYLSKFLFTLEGGKYQKFFRFKEPLVCGKPVPKILATIIMFEFKPMFEPEVYLPAKVAIETIVNDLPLISNKDAFRTVWSRVFFFWDADQTIGTEVIKNLGLTMLAVMICAMIVLLSVKLCFWIFLCVLITMVNAGGVMYMWGVTLSVTTALAMQFSIGFSVDYASHVAQTFRMTSGTSRHDRALKSILHIGPAVFYGGFTTYMSVSMLSWSALYSYIQFSRVILLFIFFGLFTGLVLLPVVLSLVGPDAKSSTVSSDKPPATGSAREETEMRSNTNRQGMSNVAYQPE